MYLSVESYFPKSMPKDCHSKSVVDMEVSLDSRPLESSYFYDNGH